MACDPLSSDRGGCELSDVPMAPATAIPRDVWTVVQSGVAPRDVVVGSLHDRKRRSLQCDGRASFNLASRDPSPAPMDASRVIHADTSRAIHARTAAAGTRSPPRSLSTFTQPPSSPPPAALALRRSATGEARDLATKPFPRTLTTTSNPAPRPLLDPDRIVLDSDMARATCPSSADSFRQACGHDVLARNPQSQDWSVPAGRSFLPRLDRIHISPPAPSPGVAFPNHDLPRPAQQQKLGLSASAPHGSLPLRLQCSWMWEQPIPSSQPSQPREPGQRVQLIQSTDEPPPVVYSPQAGHATSPLPSRAPAALAPSSQRGLEQAVHSPKKPRGSPEALGRQALALAVSEREEEIFQRRREQRLRILGDLTHALDEPAAACAAAVAAGPDGQSPLFVIRQGPFSCRIRSRACNAEKASSKGGVTEMREKGLVATGGGAVEGGDTTAAGFAPGDGAEAGANGRDGGGVGVGRRSDEERNGAGALAEPRTRGATLAVELRSTMRVEVTSPHAAALASLDARKALPFLAAPFAPLPAGWKQQRRVRARSAFESRDLIGGGAEGFPSSPGQAELIAEGALRSPALAREAAECGKRAQKRRNSSEWELYASREGARGEWGRGETGGPADTRRGGRSSRGGDSSVGTRRDGTGPGVGGGEAERGGQHEVESRGGAREEREKEGAREEEWEWVNSGGHMGSEGGGGLSSSGAAGVAARFPLWVRNSEAESYLHSAAQPMLLADSMGES
ncbi:unnamed protein product [Closterium sp. Yama58-4]|nr:unnamed protein product [Closterium sp. Yama58-4]